MCCATCPSPPSTRPSRRPALGWVRSTAGSARRTWPGWSARSGRGRSGSCSTSTTPRRPSAGAWSTRSCRRTSCCRPRRSGARRSPPTARPRCASSSTRSTRTPTTRAGCRSWPSPGWTRSCRPTRRRRAQTPSPRSASRSSASTSSRTDPVSGEWSSGTIRHSRPSEGKAMSIQIDLSSDVAVVTGGGSGIGEGIAMLLAEAGAKVAVADLSDEAAKTVAEQITSAGGTAIGVQLNIADEDSVRQGLESVREQLGPVSVLVNNAATWTIKKFADTTAEETQRIIDITLVGTINVMRAALPDLLETQGRIVNIASDSARTGEHSMSVYAGAKAGVIAMTKSLALEVGRKGVRANAVAPGTTVTPGSSAFIEQVGGADKLARAYPLGRLGSPDDIAGAVLFLASPLSAWITGQVLSVSGGYTMV